MFTTPLQLRHLPSWHNYKQPVVKILVRTSGHRCSLLRSSFQLVSDQIALVGNSGFQLVCNYFDWWNAALVVQLKQTLFRLFCIISMIFWPCFSDELLSVGCDIVHWRLTHCITTFLHSDGALTWPVCPAVSDLPIWTPWHRTIASVIIVILFVVVVSLLLLLGHIARTAAQAAACCYRCRTFCGLLCKNVWTDREPIWDCRLTGPKSHVY